MRDAGGNAAARGLEMYLIFWVGLRSSSPGQDAFNVRVVA